MQFQQIDGLIFDLDGTLADTQLDFSLICKEAGVPVGTPLLEFCEQHTSPHIARRILDTIEHHEINGAKNARWIDGAEEMLTRLEAAQIPMAIVTRNMRKAATITINKLNIPINQIITREDCRPKPDPEGLLMVAESWGIKSKNLAYVGDYKYDLLAARSAGMLGVLLNNDRNQQFHHLADKVINNFTELTQWFDIETT